MRKMTGRGTKRCWDQRLRGSYPIILCLDATLNILCSTVGAGLIKRRSLIGSCINTTILLSTGVSLWLSNGWDIVTNVELEGANNSFIRRK